MTFVTIQRAGGRRSHLTSSPSLLASLLLFGCTSPRAPETTRTATDLAARTTVYAVALECSAAPAIGCGSRAKPILRELERLSAIDEAWLSRSGTHLAVVWAEDHERPPGSIDAAVKESELVFTELAGTDRAQAIEELRSGSGWHRAEDVDRLSEEEAAIIALRFVRRVQAKTPLKESRAKVLRSALTDTLKRRFLASPDESPRTLEEEREAFLEAAASYLDEAECLALREAVASGLCPLPGEE